ncbi:MAG TPA: TetR/AcrR family transcriptional regulator [Candidatus Dormibacteraeota bacterium]|nr:TetR/AcrR family transcriptional regulator [Candidatus Dormibacteraeota bacterium]
MRSAVLDATAQLVLQKGFGATSVAEIAERAGVNETSIYRRWGSKENLGLEVALSRAELAIPVPDTGSLRGDLLALARGITAYQHTPISQAMLRSALGNAPDANRKAFWEARQRVTSAALKRAEARGELRGDFDQRLVLEMLVGLLFMRNFLSREPTDDEALVQIVDVLLRGVGTAGS